MHFRQCVVCLLKAIVSQITKFLYQYISSEISKLITQGTKRYLNACVSIQQTLMRKSILNCKVDYMQFDFNRFFIDDDYQQSSVDRYSVYFCLLSTLQRTDSNRFGDQTSRSFVDTESGSRRHDSYTKATCDASRFDAAGWLASQIRYRTIATGQPEVTAFRKWIWFLITVDSCSTSKWRIEG